MQFSTIAIFAYVNLLRVMDHKIKIPTFGHKHNLLSKNQSKVRTVGYGGGRVSVPSFISSPISHGQKFEELNQTALAPPRKKCGNLIKVALSIKSRWCKDVKVYSEVSMPCSTAREKKENVVKGLIKTQTNFKKPLKNHLKLKYLLTETKIGRKMCSSQ